jgi:hypothetical protein
MENGKLKSVKMLRPSLVQRPLSSITILNGGVYRLRFKGEGEMGDGENQELGGEGEKRRKAEIKNDTGNKEEENGLYALTSWIKVDWTGVRAQTVTACSFPFSHLSISSSFSSLNHLSPY